MRTRDTADDYALPSFSSLNLRLCRRLLEAQCGMDVATANDGDVALAWLASSYAPGGPTPVDIVLMDMQARVSYVLRASATSRGLTAALTWHGLLYRSQMPRLDGLEATRRFRAWEAAQPPHAIHHAGGVRRLPIIALSANVFDEKVAECRAAGMDGALAAGLPGCIAVLTPRTPGCAYTQASWASR